MVNLLPSYHPRWSSWASSKPSLNRTAGELAAWAAVAPSGCAVGRTEQQQYSPTAAHKAVARTHLIIANSLLMKGILHPAAHSRIVLFIGVSENFPQPRFFERNHR